MTDDDWTMNGEVLRYLREMQRKTRKDLALASGEPEAAVYDWERGRVELKLSKLEKLAAALGCLPFQVTGLLTQVRLSREQRRPGGTVPSPHASPAPLAAAAKLEALLGELQALQADALRQLLAAARSEQEARLPQLLAPALWGLLKPLELRQRRMAIREAAVYRSWALVALLCAESIRAAADEAGKAMELAELARELATLLSEEGESPGWRARVTGYAMAHAANALKVQGELPAAEAMFVQAQTMWEAGKGTDPGGRLDEARFLGLHAALLKERRKMPESLARWNEALRLPETAERQFLLLGKEGVLEALGDSESALELLEEAERTINREAEPRLELVVRFNQVVHLCHLDRFAEAELRIPELRRKAEELGNALDLLRLLWLEGRIEAGLGRRERSLAILANVRQRFDARQNGYEVALVSLNMALLLTEAGRFAEVRTLAAELATSFSVLGVHQEALAALQLFCNAVQQGMQTPDLIRSLLKYFYRAQHDPELRFDKNAWSHST